MGAPSSSLDTTSKCWLAALALAILISTVILTRSFINAFSPPEDKSIETQQSAQDSTKKVTVAAQPEWITLQQSHPGDRQRADMGSPFNDSDFPKPKNDAAVRKEMVHKQAEQLRAMVKQNKLPEVYGHLTMEQIDEMEKKGIMIE
jgi:hypothetical protein